MKHWMNEGKEYLKNNQGRTPGQKKSNYQMTFWSFIGLILCIIYILITN